MWHRILDLILFVGWGGDVNKRNSVYCRNGLAQANEIKQQVSGRRLKMLSNSQPAKRPTLRHPNSAGHAVVEKRWMVY